MTHYFKVNFQCSNRDGAVDDTVLRLTLTVVIKKMGQLMTLCFKVNLDSSNKKGGAVDTLRLTLTVVIKRVGQLRTL